MPFFFAIEFSVGTTPAHSERLGSKVAELEQSFHRVVSNSKLKPPKREGETDSPIRDFLEKVKNFFEWKKEHVPRRRHEIASTMRALDGPGRVIPSDLEKIAVEEWLDVKDYFVNVAHHQTPDPSGEDFDGHLTSLERILLRKLNPPTFADFDALDAIIEAGETQ